MDYEIYLNTEDLLPAKPFAGCATRTNCSFKSHQVEELWMKLIAYTLLDIDEYLAGAIVLRTLTLFERCNRPCSS